MVNLERIADNADMIVNGYAFTRDEDKVHILNLNNASRAAVLLKGDIIETTMDDIEAEIVKEYYDSNKRFMEG